MLSLNKRQKRLNKQNTKQNNYDKSVYYMYLVENRNNTRKCIINDDLKENVKMKLTLFYVQTLPLLEQITTLDPCRTEMKEKCFTVQYQHC